MKVSSNEEIIRLLQSGTMEVEGHLPWSSNYTFLARVCDDEDDVLTVYKPRRGERPLWDFSQGTLCKRERAAFLVSELLGWHLVPPTVLRDGRHGTGSVQLFIDHDPEHHYFTFEGNPVYRRQLQQIVLLDIIINNADRKGGHILLDQGNNDSKGGRLWAIDHGVCFHTSHKLRTVVWEFAGMTIPDDLYADLVGFKEAFYTNSQANLVSLKELLHRTEVNSLLGRLDCLIDQRVFSHPGPGRHYPWPPV